MSWKWFGVKTVYRIEAKGMPVTADDRFDPEATGVEERVVLIRARSFDEAIAKGEAEAKEYASDTYTNPYGQVVRTRFLRKSDAFELYDDPGANVEVYSSTELMPKATSNQQIVDQHFGVHETKAVHKTRRKFFNAKFSS